MEMSFRCGIDLKMGVRPAYMAASPEILTYRYPDGFKTGIEKERLVSIGCRWYRFTRLWTCVKARIREAGFYGC